MGLHSGDTGCSVSWVGGRHGTGSTIAYDTETDREVALKVLPRDSAGNEFQQRFRREARIAAGLNDPHIVPSTATGEIRWSALCGHAAYPGARSEHASFAKTVAG